MDISLHGITNASSLTFVVILKVAIREVSGEGLSSQSGSTSVPLSVDIAILLSWKVTLVFGDSPATPVPYYEELLWLIMILPCIDDIHDMSTRPNDIHRLCLHSAGLSM